MAKKFGSIDVPGGFLFKLVLAAILLWALNAQIYHVKIVALPAASGGDVAP